MIFRFVLFREVSFFLPFLLLSTRISSLILQQISNNYIQELKTAMMEMGDNPLSKEEAEELIRRGNPEATLGSSRIEYKPFVGIMMKAIPGAKVDD